MPPVAGEQERNLWIVAGAGLALLLLAALALVALYLGWELPPARMRDYRTSPTGYAPPPRPGALPVGSIPRGAAAPEPPAGKAPGAAAARNPRAGDPRAVAEGRRAYAVNCAMCHGEAGEGVGPVGRLYTPTPPDLARRVPAHGDAALFRAITEGIRSTPTPEAARYLPDRWHAFRADLPAEARWAIVSYLRTAFPGSGEGGSGEGGSGKGGGAPGGAGHPPENGGVPPRAGAQRAP